MVAYASKNKIQSYATQVNGIWEEITTGATVHISFLTATISTINRSIARVLRQACYVMRIFLGHFLSLQVRLLNSLRRMLMITYSELDELTLQQTYIHAVPILAWTLACISIFTGALLINLENQDTFRQVPEHQQECSSCRSSRKHGDLALSFSPRGARSHANG
jgi:hypothetical protein